jgi:AraC-like DNA-binding protein
MLISAGVARHDKGVTIHREADFKYWTCAYLRKGEIDLVTEHQRLLIGSPSFCLIPANLEYEFVVTKADEHAWFLFAPDTHVNGTVSKLGEISFVNFNPKNAMHSEIEKCVEDALSWWHASPPHIPLADNSLQRALLLVAEEIKSKKAQGIDRRIAAALEFISDNLSGNLEVSVIAKAVNISTSRFASLFKQQVNTTPARFVEAKRMDVAANLLLGTKKRVNEIAELVGYSNAFHFSRRFHSTSGQSPRDFRRKPERNRFEIVPKQPSFKIDSNWTIADHDIKD